MTDKKKGHPTEGSPKDQFDRNHKPPIVSGQCAEVLELLRTEGAVLSFRMTADLAIPEAAARIHDLRSMGFNVLTTILPEVEFRGRIRRNAVLYSLGSPSWPVPCFLDDEKRQAGFMLPDGSLLAGLLILAVAALLLIGGGGSMIRALISGELVANLQERTGKTGKHFALARVSVLQGEEGRIFCSVIAFNDDAVARLLQLKAGASVALAGTLKVSTWQAKDGTTRPQLDLVADEVASITPRPRKPKAQAGGGLGRDPFGDLPGADDIDWMGA